MSALETTLASQKTPVRSTRDLAIQINNSAIFPKESDTPFFDSFIDASHHNHVEQIRTSDIVNRVERLEKKIQDVLSRDSHVSSSCSKLKDSVLSLKQHVKQLGDSTTLACRHLTTGLSEVQEATVSIFSWADQLQRQLELLSSQLECNSLGYANLGGHPTQISQFCVPKIKISKFSSMDG
jgi:ubiquitin